MKKNRRHTNKEMEKLSDKFDKEFSGSIENTEPITEEERERFETLQRALIEESPKVPVTIRLEKWQIERMVFETFQNFAIFMYEFLIMRKLNKKTQPVYLTPVGFEKVERALRDGKGAIIITGHLGNWEWGAAMLAHLGHPLLGDPLYGDGNSAERLMLHAAGLRLPALGIDVKSPTPQDWLRRSGVS